MDDISRSDHRPSWLELETIKPMPTAAALTSLSADTLKRRYPEYVVHLSPRRVGMKLRHILEIASKQSSARAGMPSTRVR